MLSQAMESVTRAFYARSDLDLILSSPAAARKVFAVRIAAMALSMILMAVLLGAPFINVLVARGGVRWLAAYGVVVAMGATAAALAVALTVALFRTDRAEAHAARRADRRRRDRRGLRHRPAGRRDPVLRHAVAHRCFSNPTTLVALVPEIDSLLWWPARAALGDMRRSPPCSAVSVAAARRRDRRLLGALRRPRHRGRRASRPPARGQAPPLRLPPRARRRARCGRRNGRCCCAIPGWCRRR